MQTLFLIALILDNIVRINKHSRKFLNLFLDKAVFGTVRMRV